jgi:hypothetical protein
MAVGNVLGVVGCVVLADELSHVLSRDQGLGQVFIVENEEGRILKDKLSRQHIEAEMLSSSDLDRASRQDHFTVLVWMNPAGPHDDQAELREIVKGGALALRDHTGLCLCFYGLCRNALWKVERLGVEIGVPMMILSDMEGKEVDDCFGANLGGKKAYLQAITHNRGTIFVSPGYAENWQRRQNKKDLTKLIEQVENMRFVFERMEYSTVMRLENGLGDHDKFTERVNNFAKIFDFEVSTRTCDLSVFEHSYSLAKACLSRLNPSALAPVPDRSIAPLPTPGSLMLK